MLNYPILLYVFCLDVLQLMFYNAMLDVIFNAALFVCIALSSPLFTRFVISVIFVVRIT